MNLILRCLCAALIAAALFTLPLNSAAEGYTATDQAATAEQAGFTEQAATAGQEAMPVDQTAAEEGAEVPAEAAQASLLEVYFIDLGRVDGILIRCDGETTFIDVGFERDAAKAIRFLQAMGVDHIDSYIGSHAHSDHVDGAPEIIETFRPTKLYMPHENCLVSIMASATKAQQQIISQVEPIILRPGDSFGIGRATMTCLGPLSIRKCSIGNTNENDNSLILRLTHGQRSLLFTGDTSDDVLRLVNRKNPGVLRSDILKNPHHNGAHDKDVIEMIAPQYVIFCVDNDDVPKREYTHMLKSKGIRALYTGSENQGNIAVLSDGERFRICCGSHCDSVSLPQIPDLYVGQTYDVKAAVTPDARTPSRQLGWNSSDERVVVAHNGRLKAVAPGVATVTAASINNVTGSAEVRVFDCCPVMDQTELKLSIGQTAKLSGSVQPAVKESVTGEWLTTDPSVATVEGGKVTAVGEGTAQIIARLSNGAQAACQIVVRGMIAKSVSLDRKKATLKVGDTLTLTAKVKPAEYNTEYLQWSSSDDGVLWVDDYGNVTAVGKGEAKIGVVACEGVYAVCRIRVE